MIKLVIFDLDGVLVDSKESHYHALNESLSDEGEQYVISKMDHLNNYDGLPTRKKLDRLTQERKLPASLHDKIWKKKQEYTYNYIRSNTQKNPYLINLFKNISSMGLKIYVASNSIHKTTKLYLLKLGLMEYVDRYFTADDVTNPKPSSEIYLTAMVEAGVDPRETLIIEDSHVGVTAALRSGGHLCRVNTPKDVTNNKILNKIKKLNTEEVNNVKWQSEDMNIVIPMAGAGSRFAEAGFTFPKPLIEIDGKPMIQVVVENINIDGNYIYIVRKEHYIKYNLQYLLNIITPNCKIIQIDKLTEGACCTTLLAEKYINNNNPLLIANSDQYVDWNSTEFMYSMTAGNTDGGVATFENTHPKWSYSRINNEGYIEEIAEKKVISNLATVGIYYWSKGADYVKYSHQMIDRDLRVNNEFYVAPVYNQAIQDNKRFKTYNIEKMWGLGTPEDLKTFTEYYNTSK